MATESLVRNSGKKLITSSLKTMRANYGKHFVAFGIAFGMATTISCAVNTSANALEAKVSPATPKLGDTISVVVSVDNPGNVTVSTGGETYTAYEIATNQYRAFIPTTPLESAGKRTIKVSGDGQVKNMLVEVGARKFRIQKITLPPGKAGAKATEYELKRAKEFREVRTPEKFWTGQFIPPSKARMTTPYGVRRYYNGEFAKDYYHRGVDYGAGTGAPIVSPAAGKVVLVGRVSQGFRIHGNVVGIDHGQGVASIFMHLSGIDVKEGDFVKVGQTIGKVGSTGASTGPHLHWGLYVNGKCIDPAAWLSEQGVE
jgi:lysostaphin